jgi:hypothetical protein
VRPSDARATRSPTTPCLRSFVPTTFLRRQRVQVKLSNADGIGGSNMRKRGQHLPVELPVAPNGLKRFDPLRHNTCGGWR